MIVHLLASGKAALQAQAASPSNKITLTSFALAETSDFDYDPSMTSPVGHVFYSGTPSDMAWTRLSDNEIVLSMKVGYNRPYGIIGNAVLFVTFMGTIYPFVMLQLDDAARFNHHLNDADNDAGMDLYMRVIIRLTNIYNRLNLSGVTQEVCDWIHYVDGEIPDPQGTDSDQIIIEGHSATGGRPVLATNVTNEWWGMQFEKQLDDSTFGVDSGGTAGDDFVYQP
jgi:hypothetical protein